MQASEGEALGQGECHQDQPPSESDLEQIAEIIIYEGDESDLTWYLRLPLHQGVNQPEANNNP